MGLIKPQEAKELNQAFVDTVDATMDPFRLNIPFTPFARGVKGRKTLSKFILNNIEISSSLIILRPISTTYVKRF